MKIAVIGKGGREQALVETLAASPCKPQMFTYPGSDAIKQTATPIPAGSFDELISWLVDNQIDLCVAGEESYLVKEDGLANRCVAAGIPCWGPQKESAQLEASKEFAKDFLVRHNIPTGKATAVADYDAAMAAIGGQYPTVLKFDGLAAGKGVAVCPDAASAEEFLREVFIEKRFGEGRLLVEEFLTGPEISIFGAICDDKYLILCPARDYKRLQDGDEGPNTGGMGAVASRQLAGAELIKTIEETIVAPTVKGLQADGLPWQPLDLDGAHRIRATDSLGNRYYSSYEIYELNVDRGEDGYVMVNPGEEGFIRNEFKIEVPDIRPGAEWLRLEYDRGGVSWQLTIPFEEVAG